MEKPTIETERNYEPVHNDAGHLLGVWIISSTGEKESFHVNVADRATPEEMLN